LPRLTANVVAQPVASPTPTLTHVIQADGRAVIGVTSVDNHLFVLRSPSRQQVQVYDLNTFTLLRSLQVTGLRDSSWNRLTACDFNNCIYISDCNVSSSVYKVQLKTGKKIFKWSVGSNAMGLSVNTTQNLLVACCYLNKIQEYTTDGSLVREICLDKSFSPRHAIELTSGQLVICCHNKHRSVVIAVDSKGLVDSLKKQLKPKNIHDFSNPCHLAVDNKNNCILVADNLNNRIVILSRSRNYHASEFDVTSLDGGLSGPSCLHFNESQGRLYVGEQIGQRVLVFDNCYKLCHSFQ
jgi:DNA-binding beta-propeller fold protein YncE